MFQKYFVLKKVLENLGPQKFCQKLILVPKIFGVCNNCWVPKSFGSLKILGPKRILGLEKFWSWKILDPKNCWVLKIFKTKKILDSKKFWVWKRFKSREILGPEKFCVKTNLCYWKIGIEFGLIGTELGNLSLSSLSISLTKNGG